RSGTPPMPDGLRPPGRSSAVPLPPSAPRPSCTRPAAAQPVPPGQSPSLGSWSSCRSSPLASSCVALPFGLQRSGHGGGHERGNVPSQPGNLANQRRGNETVFLGRRQEQGLDIRDEVPVHARELELVF